MKPVPVESIKHEGDFCFADTPRPEPWEPMFSVKKSWKRGLSILAAVSIIALLVAM